MLPPMAPTKPSPTTFPLFSHLPFEIRSQIWTSALPGPRLVHLRENPIHEAWEEWDRRPPSGPPGSYRPGRGPPVPWDLKNYIWGCSEVPALLHTCQESRQIMLSNGYELAFSDPESGPRAYFNFSRDTVYLRHTRFSAKIWSNYVRKEFCAVDRARVKRVAIQASLIDDYSFPVNQTVSLMGGLEELLVVEGDFSGFGTGNERFMDSVEDPLVSVDCSGEQLKAEARIGEIREEKTARLAEAVQKYVEENGGDGTTYIRERIKGMEKKLRLALERADAGDKLRRQRQQGTERPSGYEIPRVRMVWLMTESCAKNFDWKVKRKVSG